MAIPQKYRFALKKLLHRASYLFRFEESENSPRQPRGWTAILLTPFFAYEISDMGYEFNRAVFSQRIRFYFLQKLWPKEGELLYRYEWRKTWKVLTAEDHFANSK